MRVVSRRVFEMILSLGFVRSVRRDVRPVVVYACGVHVTSHTTENTTLPPKTRSNTSKKSCGDNTTQASSLAAPLYVALSIV
jgi:hypothetical protein